MSFTSYATNTTAALQLSLVKEALKMADYRIQRIKDETRWQIWHKSKQRSQGVCILSYDGWGKGIGRWWHIQGEVPSKVLQILKACVEFEAKAIGGEQ